MILLTGSARPPLAMMHLSYNSFHYSCHFFHLLFTEVTEVDFLCHLTGLWQLFMMNLYFFVFRLFYYLVHMLIVGSGMMQSL
jgi:hypothetical protein